MSSISRRDILKSSAAMLGLAAIQGEAGQVTDVLGTPRDSARPRLTAEIGKVDPVATDVYFHEGNLIAKGTCNNGWVVFEDYVLVSSLDKRVSSVSIRKKVFS